MNIKKVKILKYCNYEALKNNDYNAEDFDSINTLALEETQNIVFQTYEINARSINYAIIDQNNTIIQSLCHIVDNLNNK